jgi:hypothetical protein
MKTVEQLRASQQFSFAWSRVVLSAWKDPSFKASLLQDAPSSLWSSFGVQLPEGLSIKVVEAGKSALCTTENQLICELPEAPEAQVNAICGSDPAAIQNYPFTCC